MSRAPRSPAARRSWGTDDSATNILHVDMDAFFVSVELLTYPELRGKPVAVGGRERGVISAASYEARRFGVNSAMPVATAKRRCPHLIILPVRHNHYSEVSRRIIDILHDVTPLVEQVSVDEAFLDVAGARKMFGTPVQIAQKIRERIRAAEGVPASIGIAQTKHLAKIASAHAKPDGMLLIPADASLDFLHSLPVGALWGVGEVTREKLTKTGIETIGDLARMGEQRLVRTLGDSHGKHLYALAMNKDSRPVVVERKEKSMSREQTFFDLLSRRTEAEKVLLYQAHDVAARLRRNGLLAWTISVKIRFADFSTVSRSVTLGSPTDLGAEIYEAARNLFADVNMQSGIRLLGVRAAEFSDPRDGVQLALGDDGRQSKAESVMDQVKLRFGKNALTQGSLIRPTGE